MIDYSDGDLALWGVGGFFGIILAIIFYVIAASNDTDCSKKHCDHGVPRLMAHDCLCVEPAK